MEENADRLPKRVIWGVGASVALHVVLILAFLLHWPDRPVDAPKEEVINVSMEPPPPKEEQKPKEEPKKQSEPEQKPEPKPEQKSEEKPPEQPMKPVPRPTETLPPPPVPAQQAFESAAKDEQAPKEDEPPVPPPSEQEGPDQSKANAAQKQGEDKPVAGDPTKQDPPKQATVLKDIAPPQLGPDARPKEADKAEQAGGGIVTEQTFALSESDTQGPPSDAVPTPMPKPVQQSVVANLKPAKRIYSKDTLSDPRVKEAFGKLPPKRRVVQLCSIEMLEQIRRNVPGSAPDIIGPTSITKENIDEQLMDVMDAAYHSRGQWFELSYHCEIDPKSLKITSFRFNMGAAIPKSEWGARQLSAD
jgi:Domain of Unknown Function (DUF930)